MRRRVVLALVPALLVLPACSGGEDSPPEETQAPEQVLQAARERFEAAVGLHIELTSSTIPEGRDGVSRAVGDGVVDAERPAFTGEITGRIQGNPAGVELIAIDEETWMSFFTEDFNPVDMADLGAPNPAELFRSETGVGRLLAETTQVQAGEKSRDGKDVLQTYSGTLPAGPVQDLFALGEAAQSFDVTYSIEPTSGELRAAKISGEFYEGSTTSYSVNLSEYGKSVTVDEPA